MGKSDIEIDHDLFVQQLFDNPVPVLQRVFPESNFDVLWHAANYPLGPKRTDLVYDVLTEGALYTVVVEVKTPNGKRNENGELDIRNRDLDQFIEYLDFLRKGIDPKTYPGSNIIGLLVYKKQNLVEVVQVNRFGFSLDSPTDEKRDLQLSYQA